MQIKDKRGVENMVAYHLSHLEHVEGHDSLNQEINDFFPQEHFYGMQDVAIVETPWFINFANYFLGNVYLKGLIFQQKKKSFNDMKNYFWKDPYLF